MDETAHPPVGWRSLAEAVPGGVAIQADERFVHVSEEAAGMLGVAVEDLVGEPWHAAFDDATTARLEREALPAIDGDGTWQGEIRTGPTDATPVELRLSVTEGGATVWSLLASTDRDGRDADAHRESSEGRTIEHGTERGERLLDRSRFVRTLLDAVDDVVYVIGVDGHLHLWNETLTRRLGYTDAELRAMHPKRLVPEDQRQFVPGLYDDIESVADRRVEVDLLTTDGERITHEFTGTTFEDPGTGEQFRCGVARDVTDRLERERELERYETILETVQDGVYAIDEDHRFTYVNGALAELLGVARDALPGTDSTRVFASDDLDAAAAERERVLAADDEQAGTLEATLETPAGERHLESRFRLHPDVDEEFRGSVGVIRDVTDRIERERELERQRDELATLDRISELLLETTRALVESSSREAVERTVCERLAASDLYQFAWVGERAFDDDRIVPRVRAGDGRGYLDAVTITDDESDTGRGPAGEVMRTGEVRVANVADAPFEPWREEAAARGFESVAAVPLHHGDAVYGVLVVYATRPDAFSEREQAGFDVLGRTVGFVVHAARSRELLFADAVVELEFRAEDTPLDRLATACDCTLDLEGYVASTDRWLVYLVVEGASARDVVAAAEGNGNVLRARVVDDARDGDRVELVVGPSSLFQAVTDVGGTVRTASADPSGGRLVVEVPVDADVRGVVEQLTDAYPGLTLQAHRNSDREVTTVGRPGGLLDELTDRQREALSAAYRAGYYDWPRGSTAEDVAASLDLAPATLHGHLRKAEGTLLSVLLDD